MNIYFLIEEKDKDFIWVICIEDPFTVITAFTFRIEAESFLVVSVSQVLC